MLRSALVRLAIVAALITALPVPVWAADVQSRAVAQGYERAVPVLDLRGSFREFGMDGLKASMVYVDGCGQYFKVAQRDPNDALFYFTLNDTRCGTGFQRIAIKGGEYSKGTYLPQGNYAFLGLLEATKRDGFKTHVPVLKKIR